MTIFEHVAKFMAFRYYEAAPLQKLSFLPNVWNFLVDILLMHVSFATIQLIGFIVLFTYYFAELIHFYCLRDHDKESEEKEQNEIAKKQLEGKLKDDSIGRIGASNPLH